MLNENLTKAALIKKINIQEKSNNIYSLEAFIKYFNTLNFMGLNIEKEKNVYVLKNSLNGLSLKEDEKKIFLEMLENVHLMHNYDLEKVIKKLSFKIVKYIDDKNIDENLLKEIYEKSQEKCSLSVNSNVILSLKMLIKDGSQVKIEFLNKNKMVKSIAAFVKEIKEKNNNVFIKCYVPSMGRNKNIALDSVISFNHMPTKKVQNVFKQAVIFEVYGRLVSLYKLKPSESVIDFKNNCLTISNAEEDKDVLLKRLLKYGENCKIVSPVEVRDEFLSMVDNILAKLEV